MFRWVVFLTSCPVASVGDLARVRYAAVMMDSGFLESPRLFVWRDFFSLLCDALSGRSFFFLCHQMIFLSPGWVLYSEGQVDNERREKKSEIKTKEKKNNDKLR